MPNSDPSVSERSFIPWWLAAAAAVGVLLAFCAPVKAQTCNTLIDNLLNNYGVNDGLEGAIYDTVDAKAIVAVLRMAPWKTPLNQIGQIPDPDSVAAILNVKTGRADFYLSDDRGCAYLRLGPIDRDLAEAIVGFANAPPPFTGQLIQGLRGPSI